MSPPPPRLKAQCGSKVGKDGEGLRAVLMYGYDMALATMNILDQWLPTMIYIKKGVEGDIVENKCVSGLRAEEGSVTRVTMITMHRVHAIN